MNEDKSRTQEKEKLYEAILALKTIEDCDMFFCVQPVRNKIAAPAKVKYVICFLKIFVQ